MESVSAKLATGPFCCDRTQPSHAAVANMGNERDCRKVSIQAPGLGRRARADGMTASSTYGVARPAPSMPKTSRASHVVAVTAKPSADPMKGAVQGEATTTASVPDANAPSGPS